MRVKELKFSDIYIGESDSWLTGVPGEGDPRPAPLAARDDIVELRRICEEESDSTEREEFAIRFDDVTYRVSKLISINEIVFVLRRFPASVPSLETIGIHPVLNTLLLTKGLSGLIIIAGAYGQGKTTTASAIIKARLNVLGGVAITIEDPTEMPLQGRHGEGVCYQTWVDIGGFGQSCRQAARWAPSMIFLGEVRDGDAAIEALRASLNGRLVICTMHADNVPSAVERMFALACASGGNPDDIASMLGNGLTAVFHQKLEGEPRHPVFSFLWLRGERITSPRNLVKTRRFDHLANDVQLQENQLLRQGVIAGIDA